MTLEAAFRKTARYDSEMKIRRLGDCTLGGAGIIQELAVEAH
jgi:hypothetical protein